MIISMLLWLILWMPNIIPQPDSKIGIVILGVTVATLNYWGYSDNELWKWLKERVNSITNK